MNGEKIKLMKLQNKVVKVYQKHECKLNKNAWSEIRTFVEKSLTTGKDLERWSTILNHSARWVLPWYWWLLRLVGRPELTCHSEWKKSGNYRRALLQFRLRRRRRRVPAFLEQNVELTCHICFFVVLFVCFCPCVLSVTWESRMWSPVGELCHLRE